MKKKALIFGTIFVLVIIICTAAFMGASESIDEEVEKENKKNNIKIINTLTGEDQTYIAYIPEDYTTPPVFKVYTKNTGKMEKMEFDLEFSGDSVTLDFSFFDNSNTVDGTKYACHAGHNIIDLTQYDTESKNLLLTFSFTGKVKIGNFLLKQESPNIVIVNENDEDVTYLSKFINEYTSSLRLKIGYKVPIDIEKISINYANSTDFKCIIEINFVNNGHKETICTQSLQLGNNDIELNKTISEAYPNNNYDYIECFISCESPFKVGEITITEKVAEAEDTKQS